MRRFYRHAAIGVLLAVPVAALLWLSPASVLDRVAWVVFSPWFPVVLLGLYAVRPLLGWPITLLSALVGYRYGLAMGLPVALVGAALTSLPPYAVGRGVGVGDGLLGRLAAGAEGYFDATGDLRGVVAARLAPTPAEAISVAAGVSRVSVPAFVAGTLVGELPWTLLAVLAGSSLDGFAPAATGVDPRLAAVGVLAALALLAGPTYRRLRRLRGSTADAGA